MRACAPPVQHLLCGGYNRDLHGFQGGERHHGRFGTPEGEKGGGEAGGGGKQLPESQSSRRRFGALIELRLNCALRAGYVAMLR